MSTEATLIRHFQAFTKDLDALMADYTPDSVLFTPNGTLRGLEPIRGFFSEVLRTSPADLFRVLTPIRQEIDGDVAYILWKAEPYIPLATDTFVIRDGKIVAQTFAMLAASPVSDGASSETAPAGVA